VQDHNQRRLAIRCERELESSRLGRLVKYWLQSDIYFKASIATFDRRSQRDTPVSDHSEHACARSTTDIERSN
jgi:hypothetical protein